MLIVQIKLSDIFRIFFLILFLGILSPWEVNAQNNINDKIATTSLDYENIPVLVVIAGYENFYLDVLYADNNLLYVNVQELFLALHIPCISEQNEGNLSGFILNEKSKYLIDNTKNLINIDNKTFNIKDKFIKESEVLYLESSIFPEIFGLSLTFNYRSLTLILKSDFELPVIKQQRIEKMRNNISKIQGEIIADTVVKRNYHLFKPGMADWSVASYQTRNGLTNNFLSFGLGTELLYGEADLSIKYYDKYKLDDRQIFYQWRWVDNDKTLIRQAQLGRISNQTISSINVPVIGAVIRNAPTTVRKAKGYFTISEFTEPDWAVELYINNVLVDYTRADASGLFMFNIPMVYGYTTLKLKFYGPLGEERSEERIMNVPYTIMPSKKLEYSLSAGFLQDSISSRFGKADFNYGVNNVLTIGGGLEYLSSITNGGFIPYAQLTMQPFSKLTLFGEYAHGVRTRGLLNYYFSKNSLLEIDYTKYVEGQRAILFHALEERKVKLSIPFRYKNFIGFSKLEYTEFVYKTFNYNQVNAMVSVYYKRFSTNSTTQLNWIDNNAKFATSDLSFSYRLGKGHTIRPSAKYNISENEFLSYKVAFEKIIPRGNFAISYERNVSYNDNLINVSFRYDLPYARTNISASQSNGKIYTSQSAQGSMAFGSGNKYVHKSNNSSVGKGGISLYPFLDLNNNGIFDADEKMVKLNSVRVMGSVAIIRDEDSIIRIPDLNAFTKYLIEFYDNDLENIAWRFKHKRYEVLVDPNQFKRIDIPIVSVGEVNGMAFRNINNSLKGVGRILINIYNKNSGEKVAETLSEYDGYINYLGLKPGEYLARVDSVQLSNLGLKSNLSQIDFSIKTMKEGDIVEGLDFILQSVTNDSLNLKKIAQQKSLEYFADKITAIIDTMHTASVDTLYKIQLLAVRKPVNIKDYFAKLLTAIPRLEIEETLGEDGLYHYSTVKTFSGMADAHIYQNIIRKNGWKDSFVAIYAGEKRIDRAFVIMLAKLRLKAERKTKIAPSLPKAKENLIAEKVVIEKPVQQQNVPILEKQKITESKSVEIISFVRDSVALLPNDTLYKVQLMALRIPIRVKGYFIRLQTDIPGLTVEETIDENGLYLYSTGAIRGMDQARELLQRIKHSGWETCFIVTYTVIKNDESIYKLRRKK